MNNKNLEHLKEQMNNLGFPSPIAEQVSQNAGTESESFRIYYSQIVNEDYLMYDLQFTKHNSSYEFNQYEFTLKHIPIPSAVIGGIDTVELDNMLKVVDALSDKYLEADVVGKMTKEEYDAGIDFINAANSSLNRLMEIEEGKNVAKVLMYKFSPQNEYEKFFSDYVEMQNLYEHKQTFPAVGANAYSIAEAYQTLRTNTIDLAINSILSYHDISNDALAHINSSLIEGCSWMAYNTASYYLDKHDVYMFTSKQEANEFRSDNISDFDSYEVINATSLAGLLKSVPNDGRLSIGYLETLLNEKELISQKTINMNQKNFEYLKDQVKFTGFGDALENELKEKMQKQSPEFQLSHNAKFGNDTTVATLHFKKSDQSDMYFFNRYNLSLKQEQNGNAIEQTFYINKGNNITIKEAYNLMSGRAINKDLTNKEGQVYNAWMQMDFKETDGSGNYKMKHYHQNYGYDLEKVLANHPIKELGNEQDKSRLLDSLSKGNRQSVTIIENGNEQKHFIEANPKFKSINVYDGSMQRVVNKQAKGERETQGETNTSKQEAKRENQKQSDADDGPEVPKASTKRKRKQGQSM